MKVTVFKDKDGKRISEKKAIEIVGRQAIIAGIERSAFHWDTSVGDGENVVYLDSSKYFE